MVGNIHLSCLILHPITFTRNPKTVVKQAPTGFSFEREQSSTLGFAISE
jgi:hypothetical protein